MLKLTCVLLLMIVSLGLGDSVTDGTTLVQAFLIHRHGDRTPTSSSSTAIGKAANEAVAAISAKYGYGQLTEVGKRSAYELGKFIRARYDSLLSPQYNKSEIYIRSTDSTRTKMTVLTAMAAVYPVYPGSWSQKINWVPIPYTTVPAKYDFNFATLNCPNFITIQYSMMFTNSSGMDKYNDVMEVLYDVSGGSAMIEYPIAAAYVFYDYFKVQQSMGVPLGEEIDAIMPKLQEAAGEAIEVIYGGDDAAMYNAGVLLNEFFTNAESLISGNDTQRVRVYSAHDINVFSFMVAAQITPRQGVPKYASAFSLELRKVDDTDLYVVLAVYKPGPYEDLVHLPIAGCGGVLCELDTYKTIVSKFLLDEDTWRTKCGFTDDLEIDDSNVA